MLAVALRSAGVVVLYFGGHGLVAHALAVPDPAAGAGLGWGLVAIGFAALFAVQTTLLARPEGRLARALHPWLFAGFYLDERFTRLTFRVWPPRLPRGPAASTATHTAASMEA
jgi:NAD(P)H-quinone oxidoreductase subunit 5